MTEYDGRKYDTILRFIEDKLYLIPYKVSLRSRIRVFDLIRKSYCDDLYIDIKTYGNMIISYNEYLFFMGDIMYEPGPSDRIRKYSTKTKQWVECSSMIRPRFKPSCCLMDRKIFITGGNFYSRPDIRIELYDIDKDECKIIYDIFPFYPMLYHLSIGLDRRLYFILGEPDSGHQTKISTDVKCLDLEMLRWHILPKMNEDITCIDNIVHLNGTIYATGRDINDGSRFLSYDSISYE